MHQMTYDFGDIFQNRVAKSVTECYINFDAHRERIWIAEYKGKRKGCLILQDDNGAARFGYFIIDQRCRGIGLGRDMITLFMDFAKEVGYKNRFYIRMMTYSLQDICMNPMDISMWLLNGFHMAEMRCDMS